MAVKGEYEVGAKASNESYANWRSLIFASLQKLRLKGRTGRSNIEDRYLQFQIPGWIRKHLTFYRLHFLYFLSVSTCGTIILYVAHRLDARERHFTVVDSIFNVVSVVTVTGLSTVRIADLSHFDQVLLVVLMILGSQAFTSLIPLCVRRFYFFRYHRMHEKEIIAAQNASKLETQNRSVTSENQGTHAFENQRVARSPGATSTPTQFWNKPLFITSPGHSAGTDGRETHQLTLDIVRAFDRPEPRTTKDGNDLPSDQQQQETSSSPINIMRTIEHKGLMTLSWMVPLYIVTTPLVAIVLNLILLVSSRDALELLRERNLNTVFFSVMTVISSFTNSGVPANDDNLVPFQKQYALLVLYTTVSLMGNLLFPVMLRLLIMIVRSLASDSRKPVYSYLLDHPRHCFTHLFPHKQTVWLAMTVAGFTIFQLVILCAVDWNEALADLDPAAKVIDGIYQSVSVRNAGGAVIVISQLTTAVLVLYVFMMFIASYPVVLLRRNSTVYENTEIGIYDKKWEEALTDNSIVFQSRKLLARDSCYLCLILFVICLIEKENIKHDPLNYSVFNIIFEIVSAYGGVGMSVGYSCSLRLPKPNQELPPCVDVPYSLSGKWTAGGKIILAIVMFIGRHRGLPHNIDSAIQLPYFHRKSSESGHCSPGPPESRNRSLTSSPPLPHSSGGKSLNQHISEDG